MSIYLIRKQCGYQTCCPGEEAIIGYFRPENPDTIEFYKAPSYDSEKWKKEKSIKHEKWKYTYAGETNIPLSEVNETYGNIYEVEEYLIGKSNGLWGWEKAIDKVDRITWIRIDDEEQIWAPINEYYESSSSDEEDEPQELTL